MGTVIGSAREIEIVKVGGEAYKTSANDLVDDGVPDAFLKKRITWEGDLAAWEGTFCPYYLQRLGISLGPSAKNRQQILRVDVDSNYIIHAPALVLMRAFFQPAPVLLSFMFRPTGLEQLSFVNYGEAPLTVAADGLCSIRPRPTEAQCRNISKTLSWLQLSKSARSMAWSVFRRACVGEIAFDRPEGRALLLLEGVWRRSFAGPGRQFIATRAKLHWVAVSAADSLTGEALTFDWRRGPKLGKSHVVGGGDGLAGGGGALWESGGQPVFPSRC